MNALADKTLWDTLGNKCRVEMYEIGVGRFEVYFHDFNDAVPRRFIGNLGTCNLSVDCWLHRKRSDGFVEQLPSYNPEAWRA